LRFAALAADYDGTLATHGSVGPEVVAALRRFATTGRKLLLVTGRELNELLDVFPDIGVFDRVVAENGGLLFCPRTGARKPLGTPPPPEFVAELGRRRVHPLAVGQSIVATVTPNETAVLETIRDLGLELQVIFNKGAVMVLPAGVNKASGLAAALEDLKLSPRNVAAIGDAENDHALLRASEFGVAVANALPMLKRDADRASGFGHGRAVCELIDAILADDLHAWSAQLRRRAIALGTRADGTPVLAAPDGSCLLLAGQSGSGKSVYAAGILERVVQHGYQYCVIDPEGDYAALTDAVALGSAEREPTLLEVEKALEHQRTSVVVSLAAWPAEERPAAFGRFAARLAAMRAACGRPHWLLVGEAHRLFRRQDPVVALPTRELAGSTLFVTVHPERMSPAALEAVDLLLAIGADAPSMLESYCAGAQRPPPSGLHAPGPAEALAWLPRAAEQPFRFVMQQSETEQRHQRQRLLETTLPAERSFYFRGPRNALNLRAQSLALFLQIGSGVDEATWLHHLRRGDYSRWLREAIHDLRLAAEVASVESSCDDAAESLARVRRIMETFLGTAEGVPASG